MTVCQSDVASGGSGKHGEVEKPPTAKQIKDSCKVAAAIVAAPIVVAAAVIAGPEIAAASGRSVVGKVAQDFGKSITKDAIRKSLAIGLNATNEVQGSLVVAERITGTAAAVVEENASAGALASEAEALMNAVLRVAK